MSPLPLETGYRDLVRPVPRMVESGWLVTGRDTDPDYLMQVRLEVEYDGSMWRVKQRVCGTDERQVDEYATEDEARGKLAAVYAYGEQQDGTRWRIRTYPPPRFR